MCAVVASIDRPNQEPPERTPLPHPPVLSQTTLLLSSYVVVGNVKIGKCFSFPSCNPCRGSLAEECATRLSECVACTMGCLKEHVVKPGDDCSSIAKANSLALDAVKALNPGVCGPGLQDNTKLCLVFGKTDDCKRVCEGTEI